MQSPVKPLGMLREYNKSTPARSTHELAGLAVGWVEPRSGAGPPDRTPETRLARSQADSIPVSEANGTETGGPARKHSLPSRTRFLIGDPPLRRDRSRSPAADSGAGLAIPGLAAGFLAGGRGPLDARKRRPGRLLSRRRSS
jgi:hypothetical protein